MDMKPKNMNRMAGLEPGVLALNNEKKVDPRTLNFAQDRQKIANARPLAYKKGGAVKHTDAAQDKKLIKSMIAKAKPMKKASGGAAKVRKGVMSQSGQIKQAVPRSKGGC